MSKPDLTVRELVKFWVEHERFDLTAMSGKYFDWWCKQTGDSAIMRVSNHGTISLVALDRKTLVDWVDHTDPSFFPDLKIALIERGVEIKKADSL